MDLTHDDVRAAAKHMFERMDADLVFSDNEVSRHEAPVRRPARHPLPENRPAAAHAGPCQPGCVQPEEHRRCKHAVCNEELPGQARKARRQINSKSHEKNNRLVDLTISRANLINNLFVSIHILKKGMFPISGQVTNTNNPAKRQCRTRRPRRNRSASRSIVIGRAHGDHGIGVVVLELEHLGGDFGPGGHAAGVGQVVRAELARLAGLGVALAIAEQQEDALGHVAGEGQAAELVVDHRHPVERVIGVGAAV